MSLRALIYGLKSHYCQCLPDLQFHILFHPTTLLGSFAISSSNGPSDASAYVASIVGNVDLRAGVKHP
jgi:hypothetical protein